MDLLSNTPLEPLSTVRKRAVFWSKWNNYFHVFYCFSLLFVTMNIVASQKTLKRLLLWDARPVKVNILPSQYFVHNLQNPLNNSTSLLMKAFRRNQKAARIAIGHMMTYAKLSVISALKQQPPHSFNSPETTKYWTLNPIQFEFSTLKHFTRLQCMLSQEKTSLKCRASSIKDLKEIQYMLLQKIISNHVWLIGLQKTQSFLPQTSTLQILVTVTTSHPNAMLSIVEGWNVARSQLIHWRLPSQTVPGEAGLSSLSTGCSPRDLVGFGDSCDLHIWGLEGTNETRKISRFNLELVGLTGNVWEFRWKGTTS